MILAPLFDSLKAYRREQGELILYYIQNDLSDGRLIKVLGRDNAQYLPLLKEETLEYDLIVDDMPSSPNQKEMSWQIIMQMMPILAKAGLTPETLLLLLEDSPLNSTTLDKLKGRAQEQMQSPMAQLQQQVAGIQAQLEQMKVANMAADTELKRAQAVAALQKAPDPQAEMELKALETTGHIRLAEAKAQSDVAVAQQKAASDIQVAQTKAAIEMQAQAQEHASNMQMAREEHRVDMAAAVHGMVMDHAKTSADIANKRRQATAKPAK
jgi:hypothetical protein